MRVRKRKKAEEYLLEYPQLVVSQPDEWRGRWCNRFQNNHPIHIEVGCGKGRFITEMSKRNPDINYLGLDIQLSVLSYALDKVIAADVLNLQLLYVDGRELLNYFAENEISLIYLNFSDPWPKSRHEKRRLTYSSFLKIYEKILTPKGEVYLKTDNRGLFEYSLVSFSNYGMILRQIFLNLHASNFVDNVITEYEEKFINKGQVIYRVEAQFT
ncbi:MAG: tRNA (guanosine(46)-N7)-methyltransferase TrmB [Streptococcaceae bacterium]|jgi:tRNA (guanine-N7-)-methyltransferase|nr:tRNA (guanosine(46)-N7)-methyltransferase TrmB [Streptococcaceae bacterium]